ncbi:24-methylenesterol C-methyltransferase 2-like [Zingiber officinale]|uniref:24-methylenesterol C-methyltransferase 2-like n=1 Tax=Zingiber officinale TaxID=94328 RepID=UPI001C4AD839|nr:24-methylenesterol C-methyltransferase 2-like [Zingiber officinale]
MDLSTAMWTATVVGAVAVYWTSTSSTGPSFSAPRRALPSAASDNDNVPAFVDTFYNLVTDIYEWGWGQSFHFSPSLPGRSHREATRIHEEPAADLRDGVRCLRLGRIPTLVVSSPDTARDVLRTHDHICASRSSTTVTRILLDGCSDMAFAPYDDEWRQRRQICTLHQLSPKMV